MHSHRKKRVSVVCNHHIDMNTGKVAEHLALHFIARRHGFTDLKYFELLSPDEHFAGSPIFKEDSPYNAIDEVKKDNDIFLAEIPIHYHRLLGSLKEVTSSDAILFWSSWPHTPIFYNIYKQCLINTSIAASEAEAYALIDEHLYFVGQSDDVFDKTISFCETLIFNTIGHEIEGAYAAAYRNFFGRIRSAYMREVISWRKVNRLRGIYPGDCAPIDAAMLLRDEDIDLIPKTVSDSDLSFCRGKVGVFFGRSDLTADEVMPIVNGLCRALDTQAFALPWATKFNFPKTKDLPLQSASRSASRLIRPGDSLALLRGARAIITDTYHVCVNAWARGVPAVCVGSPMPKGADGNSGYLFTPIDKRHILYIMLEAMDFYVHYPELLDPPFLQSHIDHIGEIIRASAIVKKICDGLQQEARAAERVLVRELDNVLTSSS